jgi:hypothetical protein
VPGFDERDAAADPAGGSADWVADVIGSFLLCPSGGSNEDVPSSVELRWRPGDHQAALTVSS